MFKVPPVPVFCCNSIGQCKLNCLFIYLLVVANNTGTNAMRDLADVQCHRYLVICCNLIGRHKLINRSPSFIYLLA